VGIGDEVRARRHGVALSAQRLFTNREEEVAAFAAKLAAVRAVRADNPDVNLDLRSGRRNVLAFYGQGGIGKTRLSNECQRLFAEPKKPKGIKRAAVRVDFSEPSSRDPELYLLALRAGVAGIARSFPAFDTCLALYWARRHPGVSMVEFVRNQSSLGGVVDRDAFASNLRDFIQEFLLDSAGPVVGGASRAVLLTWERIRQSKVIRNLGRECPYLESCVQEEDLDELRLHLPLLLGWDLSRLQRHGDVDIAVFLDAFEHVSHGRRRARRGDIEDAIARSIFFLPSALFIVTSRNRLDWGSPRRAPTLEYAGAEDWPGLAETGSSGDQHLVGALSLDDCQEHLETCLLDEHGQAAIPADLRAAIASLSDGVPLYLDVATNHFRSLAVHGRTPGVEDFARGVPEIVLRLMEDLGDDEADLLRAAALLGVFDRETLHAALPDMRSASVEHFLDRSFVFDRGESMYSVHEMLQTSVRLQDPATSDPWSRREWDAVETRLVSFWADHLQDPGSRLWRDRRSQSLAFWQLVGLYATTGVDAEPLADIMMQVQLRGVWATIYAARSQSEVLLTDRGRAFLLMLDGMMERQIGRLGEADKLLSHALASPALEGNVRRLAMYYLGETRDIHVGDPAPLFHSIAEQADRLGTEARIAWAHSLTRHEDLVGALAIAEQVGIDEHDPEFRYRMFELLGVIWWSAGRMTDSAAYFEQSRQVALAEKSPLLLALATRHLGLASCWSTPSVAALPVIDEAEALNRDLGLKPGIGQCLMTRATALAGTAPLPAIDDLTAQAEETFASGGYVDDAIGPLAISVFAAAVAGDQDLAEQRRRHLQARAEGRRPRHWLAVADVWTGHREAFERMAWPQGAEQAWRDWRQVLTDRRSATTPRPE
jgi:hypothetical protein